MTKSRDLDQTDKLREEQCAQANKESNQLKRMVQELNEELFKAKEKNKLLKQKLEIAITMMSSEHVSKLKIKEIIDLEVEVQKTLKQMQGKNFETLRLS